LKLKKDPEEENISEGETTRAKKIEKRTEIRVFRRQDESFVSQEGERRGLKALSLRVGTKLIGSLPPSCQREESTPLSAHGRLQCPCEVKKGGAGQLQPVGVLMRLSFAVKGDTGGGRFRVGDKKRRGNFDRGKVQT